VTGHQDLAQCVVLLGAISEIVRVRFSRSPEECDDLVAVGELKFAVLDTELVGSGDAPAIGSDEQTRCPFGDRDELLGVG